MSVTIDSFFSTLNRNIDPPIRSHLKNVYAHLSMSLMSAGAGAYVTATLAPWLAQMGLLVALGSLGLGAALHFTPDNGKNRPQRVAMLLGFAFLSGIATSPLIQMAVFMNPAIIVNAFLLTSMIFICFTLAAMLAPAGHYLYLGGMLMSGLSALFWMGLANIFFGSTAMFQAHIWLGLLVFCGFVVYDTQMIIERRRMGDKDAIKHALDLFIDFMQIFRKIIIILMQKDQNRNERKSNKRR